MDNRKDLFSPKNLPGSIWGVTCFFNPANYKTKKQNYTKFRNGIKKQGLKLLTVECVFKNQKFSLNKNDADILIQRRASSVLWQKERLLNIGFENLPDDCDKVVFLDADIIFENENWVNETIELLNTYKVVQPYAKVLRLPKEGLPDRIFVPKQGYLEMEEQNSMAFNMFKADNTPPSTTSFDCGHPGYAWALRREVLEGLGLYDRLLSPAADIINAHGFYGSKNFMFRSSMPKNILEDADKWIDSICHRTKRNISYTQGRILHLWHGNQDSRFYLSSLKKLSESEMLIEKDFKFDKNGCWQLTSDAFNLDEYFHLRCEDGFRPFTLPSYKWSNHIADELFNAAYYKQLLGNSKEAIGFSIQGILLSPWSKKWRFFRILTKVLLGKKITARIKIWLTKYYAR